MASVSSTFTALGVSSTLFVKNGEKCRLAITGTWVGTVKIQESNNGGQSYRTIETLTANFAQDLASTPYDRLIRLECTAYTSGTITYSFANITSNPGRIKYTNVGVGDVAYASVGTNTAPSATEFYLTDIIIPYPVVFSATGVGVLNGGTVGTDTMLVALYDASGSLLANSALAGATTSGANAFQQFAFLVPVVLQPGRYIVGVQISGTTTRFRTVATATNVDIVGGSITSVFGTVPATITVPTTLTADKAPIVYLY